MVQGIVVLQIFLGIRSSEIRDVFTNHLCEALQGQGHSRPCFGNGKYKWNAISFLQILLQKHSLGDRKHNLEMCKL